MPLESDPSSGSESQSACPAKRRMCEDATLALNLLGEDRPTWLAAINLAAARHFLNSDPPRLAGSRGSLLRLVNSLEPGSNENDIVVPVEWRDNRTTRSESDLRDVARHTSV